MKAYLKNYRQSPRKVRLLADMIRGKKVEEALTMLAFTPKRASQAMSKLLKSAIANAKQNDKQDSKELKIMKITVDEGVTLKRSRPVSRGSTHKINKRTSNVAVELSE